MRTSDFIPNTEITKKLHDQNRFDLKGNIMATSSQRNLGTLSYKLHDRQSKRISTDRPNSKIAQTQSNKQSVEDISSNIIESNNQIVGGSQNPSQVGPSLKIEDL